MSNYSEQHDKIAIHLQELYQKHRKLDEEITLLYNNFESMALTMTKDGLGMVPFTFTVSPDTELEVNLTTIVFIAKTEKTMANQYLESTTGIKLT